MFEINGTFGVAKCYAKVVEDSAIEQIKRMCDYEFTKGSVIRIMPDVHSGKGCTIGTTMTVTDKIVPNIVGVDIGCGMLTVKLGCIDIDFEKLDKIVHMIPSGKNIWDHRLKRYDLSDLRCFRSLKDTKYLQRSIGTLGGGNHFIEIDTASDGNKYLVIHSGSRNLGKQVAEYYQNLAIDLNQGKDDYFKKRDKIIRQLKQEGRKKEIQKELKKLRWERRECYIPDDLCHLYGHYLEDYLFDVAICQDYAKLNRDTMASIILKEMGMEAIDSFHTIHNYIDIDEMIIRKGAIAAHEGQKLLIPVNMRDGSILATGRGNKEWNYSAPHGAGRIMSRTMAKEQLSVTEYKKTMEGIYSTSVNEQTLDEAPFAYKSLEDIIDVVKESVDVIEVLKPVYNFKACD